MHSGSHGQHRRQISSRLSGDAGEFPSKIGRTSSRESVVRKRKRLSRLPRNTLCSGRRGQRKGSVEEGRTKHKAVFSDHSCFWRVVFADSLCSETPNLPPSANPIRVLLDHMPVREHLREHLWEHLRKNLREHLWERLREHLRENLRKHPQEAEPGLRSESLPVGPRTRAGVALSAPSSAACQGRGSQGRGAWSRRGTGRMKACVQITGKNGSR